MTDQSQSRLVGPAIRRDPVRRKGGSPPDRSAGEKASPGLIWSSCMVVSVSVASFCSFVVADHDEPRSAASQVSAGGQASVARDGRCPRPADIREAGDPPGGDPEAPTAARWHLDRRRRGLRGPEVHRHRAGRGAGDRGPRRQGLRLWRRVQPLATHGHHPGIRPEPGADRTPGLAGPGRETAHHPPDGTDLGPTVRDLPGRHGPEEGDHLSPRLGPRLGRWDARPRRAGDDRRRRGDQWLSAHIRRGRRPNAPRHGRLRRRSPRTPPVRPRGDAQGRADQRPGRGRSPRPLRRRSIRISTGTRRRTG